MPKLLTMRAKVAFDYRGAQIRPGQSFTPHNAAEAVVLKNRKQADFERATQRKAETSGAPLPVPVAPSRALETSQLTAADDQTDPGDSPLTTSDASTEPPSSDTSTRRARGTGRGRYNRQDLRAQS